MNLASCIRILFPVRVGQCYILKIIALTLSGIELKKNTGFNYSNAFIFINNQGLKWVQVLEIIPIKQ